MSVGKKMQWIRMEPFRLVMAQVGPHANVPVTGDAVGQLSSAARLIRFWCRFRIATVNLTGGLGTGNLLSIGLIRGTGESPTGNAIAISALGPLDTSNADKSWLYRKDYALPNPIAGGSATGEVEYPGDTYDVDWPMRSGRGTNLDRDVEIRLAAEVQLEGDGDVYVFARPLMLFETA